MRVRSRRIDGSAGMDDLLVFRNNIFVAGEPQVNARCRALRYIGVGSDAPAESSRATGGNPTMTKSILCCISILGLSIFSLVAAAGPGGAGEPAARDKRVLRSAASLPNFEDDCETRMRKLDASDTEGAERLAEKNVVIDYCASQYKRDRTIERLVKACEKYEEQPVVKQQLVAECQLAAFNYANALHTLRAEYRK
jgi:hypothetical protein